MLDLEKLILEDDWLDNGSRWTLAKGYLEEMLETYTLCFVLIYKVTPFDGLFGTLVIPFKRGSEFLECKEPIYREPLFETVLILPLNFSRKDFLDNVEVSSILFGLSIII